MVFYNNEDIKEHVNETSPKNFLTTAYEVSSTDRINVFYVNGEKSKKKSSKYIYE